MRPFIALDPLAPRSSRYLSLLAGIARSVPVPGVRAPAGRAARRRAGDLRAGACRRCTCRRRRPPPARRCTCCCGSARWSGCWRRSTRARGDGACGRSRSPGCSRRWRPSRATTRGWRCRSRCSRRWCSSARDRRAIAARPGGVLAVRGVAARRVAGLGRARGRRSAVLRALHHDRPRRAGGATSPAGSARCSGARASSGSGRWRSSRR